MAEAVGLMSNGCVIGNDVDWKRANMLAHQVSRFGCGGAVVTQVDACFMPGFIDDGQDTLIFDRVLCDVMCTGDGTLRKAPEIWKDWLPRNGLGLHPKQIGILCRGLEVLKIGGRLVYSTCSLNPMEDEAVVATALARYNGAVHLVDPPEREGLLYKEGLTS